MLFLVLASAAAASATQPPPHASTSGAVVQARASVRILSGEQIRFDRLDERDSDRPGRRRDTVLVIDGKRVAASVFEFE